MTKFAWLFASFDGVFAATAIDFFGRELIF
jgi:hypothetical protein